MLWHRLAGLAPIDIYHPVRRRLRRNVCGSYSEELRRPDHERRRTTHSARGQRRPTAAPCTEQWYLTPGLEDPKYRGLTAIKMLDAVKSGLTLYWWPSRVSNTLLRGRVCSASAALCPGTENATQEHRTFPNGRSCANHAVAGVMEESISREIRRL